MGDPQATSYTKPQGLHAWLQSQQATPKNATPHVALSLEIVVLSLAAVAAPVAVASAAGAAVSAHYALAGQQ